MKSIIFVVAVFCSLNTGCSEKKTVEKTQTEIKSVERSIKKTSHRVEEAACGTLTGDNKVQCLAKEIKNRAVEVKDVAQDKLER